MNTPSLPKESSPINFSPSFPWESSPSEVILNPPSPSGVMESAADDTPLKTVSLTETVLQKNRVVSYSINSIYMLLLYNAIEKENGWHEGIKVSIARKGGRGY